MLSQTDLADIAWAFEQAGIKASDPTVVLSEQWSGDQVPEIRNKHQLERYRSVQRGLSERAGGEAAHGCSWTSVLANAYQRRIVEWEDQDYMVED